ncbi:DUF1963 domain-containing protein [Streptomyces apricus]|uniref:DUF1963 domain-containing protein n=1 Tax=Streptomyces apricus TaxID=1828112 RepID=A0A5B0B3B5_9ACTN|nr:DUF1963 domain-containing protein [Streptomyces apricus]KAA0935852.1 DUF1963 domain-containing protein [Streptomyces apricus]
MTSIDERLVLETAAEHGVPGPVAQEVVARARPCLYLVEYDELPESRREGARPAARTGGLPALPDGMDRPEDTEPFLLSVDCAALPRDVLDIELPADGHLLVFMDIEYDPETSSVLHVPAGTPTTERPLTYENDDGGTENLRAYAPRTLYPLAGLTFGEDRPDSPATSAFLADHDNREVLSAFEEAVSHLAAGGTRPGVTVQLGGFSDSWDDPPDTGGLVLFAQLAGQAIDLGVYTMNLIVGTPEDIAARRYADLRYDQQC